MSSRRCKSLHEAGADVTTCSRSSTSIAIAVAPRCTWRPDASFKKVMAELVAWLGADPDSKDQDGLTSLDYAMSRGWLPFLTTRPAPRMDLAKTLRDLGATVELAKTPDWPDEFPPIGPPRQHEAEIYPL